MIGAFSAFSITQAVGRARAVSGWPLSLRPLVVALVSLVAERALFCHLYQREHLMLLLFTFALSLILGDLVKIVWGAEYRSIMAPAICSRVGTASSGPPFPDTTSFFSSSGPMVADRPLAVFTNKTKIGKIARAAAVDRDMVGAVGINVSWVFAFAFVLGLLSGRPRRSAGRPHREHHPRHGPRPDHRGLPDRDHRRPGEHVGGTGGFPDFRAHPVLRCAVLAAVRHRLPLHRGRDRSAAAARGDAQIRLVRREPELAVVWPPSTSGSTRSFWSSCCWCRPVLPRFYTYILAVILVTALLAMSLNMLVGHGGLFQFHHCVVLRGGGLHLCAHGDESPAGPCGSVFSWRPLAASLAGFLIGWFCVRLTQSLLRHAPDFSGFPHLGHRVSLVLPHGGG